MASQFRNRLVGTIVVVALGVIFLPDILDGKKERKQEAFAEIPLRPAIKQSQGNPEAFEIRPVAETMNLAKTSSVSNETSKSSNGGWTIEKDAVPTKEEAEKPAPSTISAAKTSAVSEDTSSNSSSTSSSNKDTGLTRPGWTIQMGSFRDISNAKALVNQLRDAGFTTYTLPRNPVAGSLTKVFVGPNLSKEKMLQLQQQVEKLTKLKARVVPFNPLES